MSDLHSIETARRNRRAGLILAVIALVFFAGAVAKQLWLGL